MFKLEKIVERIHTSTPLLAAQGLGAVLAVDAGVQNEIHDYGSSVLLVADDGRGVLFYRNMTDAELDVYSKVGNLATALGARLPIDSPLWNTDLTDDLA